MDGGGADGSADDGDEKEEKWLADNWNENVEVLIQKSAESAGKIKIVDPTSKKK